MDGSREYDLFVRQQPKQARMCGVGGMSLSPFFFSFDLFSCFRFIYVHIYFLLFGFWNRLRWGMHPLTLNEKPQPIVDQSTLHPSYNYASSTRQERTFLRPRLRPRHSITHSRLPTPMGTPPTSLPGPWTHQCSLRQASARAPSSRIRTISCLRASPSPTMTRNCIG